MSTQVDNRFAEDPDFQSGFLFQSGQRTATYARGLMISNEAYSMTTFARVGGPAPAFAAPAAFPDEAAGSPQKTVSLADYAGRWLVFFWYPADFTTVCPTEITALSDRLAEFADLNTDILGASTDSVHSHRAWLRKPRVTD